jgi:GxxExxY protein
MTSATAASLPEAGRAPRLSLQRTVPISMIYKGCPIPLGLRADIVVADAVILEIKAVAAPIPGHEAQLLSYHLSRFCGGLLLNFHANGLVDGLRRFGV